SRWRIGPTLHDVLRNSHHLGAMREMLATGPLRAGHASLARRRSHSVLNSTADSSGNDRRTSRLGGRNTRRSTKGHEEHEGGNQRPSPSCSSWPFVVGIFG